MFVSSGQFFVFLSCVAFGVIMGVLYSGVIALKRLVKIKWICVLLDVLYFCVISIFFLIYSFWQEYPSIRGYMPLGALLGVYLYLKSFHIMLAKIIKRLYNVIGSKITKRKSINGTRKSTKS